MHRSLVIAQELLNCKVILLIHHTDCVSLLDPCPSVCLNAVLGCASKQQLEQLHLDEARGAATGCLLNQEGLSQQ